MNRLLPIFLDGVALKQISGVYHIVNLLNGNLYVGSAMVISHRLNGHRCLLRANKHPNTHLQCAWNHYGEENFEMKAVEIVYGGDGSRAQLKDAVLAGVARL